MLATHVSDQPGDIGDFDILMIRTDGVRVKPEDDDIQRFDADREVDLTKLVGEAAKPVDETELNRGRYAFLQLEAEATEAKLADGSPATVTLPGETPMKFDAVFETRSGETTSFTADFTPVKQGQTGRYVLKPVADEVVVSYEGNDEASTPATTAQSG